VIGVCIVMEVSGGGSFGCRRQPGALDLIRVGSVRMVYRTSISRGCQSKRLRWEVGRGARQRRFWIWCKNDCCVYCCRARQFVVVPMLLVEDGAMKGVKAHVYGCSLGHEGAEHSNDLDRCVVVIKRHEWRWTLSAGGRNGKERKRMLGKELGWLLLGWSSLWIVCWS